MTNKMYLRRNAVLLLCILNVVTLVVTEKQKVKCHWTKICFWEEGGQVVGSIQKKFQLVSMNLSPCGYVKISFDVKGIQKIIEINCA